MATCSLWQPSAITTYSSKDGRPAAQYSLSPTARDELKAMVKWQDLYTESQLEEQLSALDPARFEAPCMFIMPDFSKHKREGYEWLSEPFYTGSEGYKLCLGVFANGYGDVHGYMSVFIHLMKGEFDNRLRWPVSGRITLKLLDQRNESNVDLARTRWEGYEKSIPFQARSQLIYSGLDVSREDLQSGDTRYIGYGYTQPDEPQLQKHDRLVFAVTDIQIRHSRYTNRDF